MTLSFAAITPILLVFILYFLGLPIVYSLFGATFYYFFFVASTQWWELKGDCRGQRGGRRG